MIDYPRATFYFVYFIFLLLFYVAITQFAGVISPITSTTHIGGHQCIVMRSGFDRSISCDWTKP